MMLLRSKFQCFILVLTLVPIFVSELVVAAPINSPGLNDRHPPIGYQQAQFLVDLLYRGALFRSLDRGDTDRWTSAIVQGGYPALLQVAGGIGSSPEARSVLWQRGAQNLVLNLYRTLLYREPDAQGYWKWVNQLESGGNPGEVLLAFANSPEFYNKNIAQ